MSEQVFGHWSGVHVVPENRDSRRHLILSGASQLREVVGKDNWFFVDIPFEINGKTLFGLEFGFRTYEPNADFDIAEMLVTQIAGVVRLQAAGLVNTSVLAVRDVHPNDIAYNLFIDLTTIGAERAISILEYFLSVPYAVVAAELRALIEALLPSRRQREAALQWAIDWLQVEIGSRGTHRSIARGSIFSPVERVSGLKDYSMVASNAQEIELSSAIPAVVRANHVQALRLLGGIDKGAEDEIEILRQLQCTYT